MQEDGAFELEEQRQSFHFAVTGKTWETIHTHCPALLKKLVVKGAVFARMSPDQKAQLVAVLQDIGYDKDIILLSFHINQDIGPVAMHDK